MRIAVLGGTFNPVHYGHLRIAEEVREALGLDKALFIPTSLTPLKEEEPISPEARLEMLKLAIRDNPHFEASDIEIKRGGRSYTVDTVRELKRADKGLKISLVVGNDSFNTIASWCEYEELFKSANFVVVQRPGYPVKKPGEALPVELARKFWYDSNADSFMNSYGNSLTYLSTTLLDISSSEIRRRVKEGGSIRYLLPEGVIDYITKKGYYRQ
ncbi:MAG: nicotinate-nucleotide adenylyltransferase [Deltaproteobacteria bacterium]|nr:nicotinate-nucleotide adenylyltransferase [Deltaproteobacteria bacterium]